MPHSPIHGTVSTSIIFAFTYMCVRYLCPHHPLPLLPGRTCTTLLFFNFVEEKNLKDNKKNMVFLLV
jgi:hypothetical protein